jgi:hypothetical protein
LSEQHVGRVFDDSDVVVTIIQPNGRDDASDFIETLANAPKARFQKYFEYLRDKHHIRSPENMRHLSTTLSGLELHELKVHSNGGLRLYIVKYENRWFATHGRKKPKDNQVNKEIDKALAIFGEWQERQEE